MSESFNSWIIEARFKPILTMLEDIRILVTRRIQENRSNNERWLMEICPNIIRKVCKIRHRTQYCHVLWNGEAGFEVRDKKMEVHSRSQQQDMLMQILASFWDSMRTCLCCPVQDV